MPRARSQGRLPNGKRTGKFSGMHYVYVLESEKDRKFYIGCTNNIERRIVEHNAGLNSSTRARRPLKLIYYEAFITQEDAFAREHIMKGKWGSRFLQRVLKNYLSLQRKRTNISDE